MKPGPHLQVLRDAQSKAQAVSPPQGATAQPQEGGLGAVGNSTIKEFEVGNLPSELQYNIKSCTGLLTSRWAVYLVGFLHRQCCTRIYHLEVGNLFTGLAAACCDGRSICSSGLHLRLSCPWPCCLLLLSPDQLSSAAVHSKASTR